MKTRHLSVSRGSVSMVVVFIAVFLLIGSLFDTQAVAADVSQLTGKLTIDRAWAEDIGGYRCSYALVTWENTTQKTFVVVTIQAIAFDSVGRKINGNQRSFFAHERGPIAPGFKGTVKIPVEIGGSQFAKMQCSVIIAR
jgi:hypothetical protein